jgi:hypothetical protein
MTRFSKELDRVAIPCRVGVLPSFFDRIIKKYEGTRLGRQELCGELILVSERGTSSHSACTKAMWQSWTVRKVARLGQRDRPYYFTSTRMIRGGFRFQVSTKGFRF